MAGCARGHVSFAMGCWSCETAARDNDRERNDQRRHNERMKANRAGQQVPVPSAPGTPLQLPSFAEIANTARIVAIVFAVGVTYLVASALVIALTPVAGVVAVLVLLARRSGRLLPQFLQALPDSWWVQLAGLGAGVAVLNAVRPHYGAFNRPFIDVFKLLLFVGAAAGLGWLALQARRHLTRPAPDQTGTWARWAGP